MKIIYCHQHFNTRKGFSGTRPYEFAKNLVNSGHEVFVICGNSERAVTGLEGEFMKGK